MTLHRLIGFCFFVRLVLFILGPNLIRRGCCFDVKLHAPLSSVVGLQPHTVLQIAVHVPGLLQLTETVMNESKEHLTNSPLTCIHILTCRSPFIYSAAAAD